MGEARARSHRDAWNAALKLGVKATALATPPASPVVEST
jgi:hypothetical protein